MNGLADFAGLDDIVATIPADLVAALDRTGSGGRKSALYAAFAILLARGGGATQAAFATGPNEGITIDARGDLPALELFVRMRPAVAERARWPAAFTFATDHPAAPHGHADLDVVVERAATATRLRWAYDPALFDAATIERRCAQYLHILRALVENPHRPMSRIPLMSADERLAVLDFGRGTLTRYERQATIHARFAQQAAATPDALAVRSPSAALTYAELDREANRIADLLRARGAAPGARIGVAFERDLRLPATLLAILKLGAAYVPLDASYPLERITFMLADAGVDLVATIDERAAAWPARGVRIDRPADPPVAEETPLPAKAATALPAIGAADDLAYVIYTAGSTGRPTGVAVPHRGVLRLVRGADYLEIAPDDVFLQLAAPAFDASTFEIWGPLLSGAQLVIPPAGLLTVDELARTVAEFGVTTLLVTTVLFGRIAESNLAAFGRLRRLLAGAEEIAPQHVRRFVRRNPRCRFVAVYGPTENTTFSTWCDLAAADGLDATVPIGRPIANSTAYVLDDQLEPVPIGTIGELFVGGDGVALGYLNLPEKTAQSFVPDPFCDAPNARLYRTGVKARFRPDGVLEFQGRTADGVKLGGFRIELGETRRRSAGQARGR